jgi:GT2 family glycosyltransferase
MKLSIVIVNYNTASLLKNCLSSIYKNPPKMEYEIIVVDNNSLDNSNEMLREKFKQVRVINNKINAGFARASNQGAAQSSGEYILFLNSDTLVCPQSLSKMVEFMDGHEKAGVMGPLLISPEEKIIQTSWGWHPSFCGEMLQKYFTDENVQQSKMVNALVANCLQKKVRAVAYIVGASLLVRKKAFTESGGFDQNLVFYFEDPDLCYRLRQAGWQIIFNPEIRIMHLLGQSAQDSWQKKKLIYRQSQLYFYRKHASFLERACLISYLYLKYAVIWLLASGSKSPEKELKKRFCLDVFALIQGRLRVEL